MPIKTPDRTTSDYATWVIAAAGLAAQFTGMSDQAKDNITTLALGISGFLVAGDTMRRFGRSKYLARILADRDKDGIPDWAERTPLAWLIAFGSLGLAAAFLVALLVVILVT